MTTYEEAESRGLIPFRVSELWRWKSEQQKWVEEVNNDRRDLKYLREEMRDLARTVEGLRKVILAFAFSVAGSAVVFALSVLIATGKIGGH